MERVKQASEMLNGKWSYVIYFLVVVIVVIIIITVVDVFFPFLPMNPIGPSVIARSSTTFWTSDGENLFIPVSKAPALPPTNYSMTIQMMIGDSRPQTTGQLRHVVHRGRNPTGPGLGLGLPPTPSIPIIPNSLPILTPVNPNIPIQSGYSTTGLPDFMNPGLLLDNYTNDLHVYIHTHNSNTNTMLLESVTIEDLPTRTPLNVGIICNGNTIEVYLNCRLYSTLLLKGTPFLTSPDNEWFGKFGTFPMIGLIKNLQLWSSAIGPTDYMSICKTPSFDNDTLPTIPSLC